MYLEFFMFDNQIVYFKHDMHTSIVIVNSKYCKYDHMLLSFIYVVFYVTRSVLVLIYHVTIIYQIFDIYFYKVSTISLIIA